MMFNDIKHHNKPHVHVFYGEFRASVAIDGTLLAGALPAKQLKAVQNWLKNNEEKAYAAQNLAVQNKHFDKIDSQEVNVCMKRMELYIQIIQSLC